MSEIVSRSQTSRSYGLRLASATIAASFAGGAFWASQNMKLAHADRLQDGAIVAGALAVALAIMASKRTPRRMPASRASKDAPVSPLPAARVAASTLRRQLIEAVQAQAIKTPAAPATPKPSAIETERARLRESGFSDPEISQILIARETGAANKPTFGSGVATGFLNNLDAIVTHVRSLVPNFKSDLARALDQEANVAERAGGAISLALKTAAVVVIGYFVYLEAMQFRAAAYKAWADACIARQQNAVNFSTMDELLSGNDHQLDSDCKGQ